MNALAPLAPLDRLAAVDLDALNAEAELQTRVDRKYILPLGDLAAVLDELPADARVLEVGGERALRYESRYFDTPALDSYLSAAHGRRRRFKVRARTYVDSDASFLEVKTRGGRSTTVKERIPVNCGATLEGPALDYAVETLAAAGIPRAERIARRLRPVLTTRYRRVTLLLPAQRGSDASRGTIDVALEWEGTDAALTLPATVIVETKSGHRAGALDRALWRYGHRPATISKYGTGLAALRPDLPDNKWRRVLSRHFADGVREDASALSPTAHPDTPGRRAA